MIKLTEKAAEGSDNIAIVYLHFLTTAAGVSATDAPCSTSSSHCNRKKSRVVQLSNIQISGILSTHTHTHKKKTFK